MAEFFLSLLLLLGSPPVLHIGPAPGPNVRCSRAILLDETRSPRLIIERCYRTKPYILSKESS